MSRKGLKTLLIVLVILLGAAAGGLWYTVESRPQEETDIMGWPESIECGADEKEVVININVEPLAGRKIELQRYTFESGSWDTVEKFSTGRIRIDKKYLNKMTSAWRVYVPDCRQAAGAATNGMILSVTGLEEIDLAAKSACIYRVDEDGSGVVLYGKNENEQLAQASTTKLMTAILLVESGKLEDTTVISKNAASTKEIYRKLKAGDEYTNHDLLYALMLVSANDAAVAIAEGVAGDSDTFVEMMNEKAQEYGLKDTHYLNPHGLDQSGHYSTALEVAKLTAIAYDVTEISETWACKEKEITSLGMGRTWKLKSTTQILGYDENFKGGKTGTQPVAGYCFTGVYEYRGETYITVVMGCENEEQRWEDTKRLHEYIRKYGD